MQYIYFKDPNGNFGDDLNGWLWPKIFGEADLSSCDTSFLGIGSILFNNHKIITNLGESRKIVFGTGVRPTYDAFLYDSSWDVRFLRGPLSASKFNNEFKHITDAAYALRFVDKFDEIKNTDKKYEVSLMPYFKSIKYFDWKSICDKLGFNYISPLSENGVEYTLTEIAASKCIITEAMHGAILADVLRVPWSRYVLTTPFTEGAMVSEFKWMDWLMSVDINNIPTEHIKFHRKSFLNTVINNISFDTINVEFLIKPVVQKDILNVLASIQNFSLSKDEVLEDIYSKLDLEIVKLKNDIRYSKLS